MSKKSKIKVSTVNVIEFSDNTPTSIISLRSFNDNKAGNKKAEKLFKKILVENGANEVTFDSFVEDGYYQNGTYTVLLTHST